MLVDLVSRVVVVKYLRFWTLGGSVGPCNTGTGTQNSQKLLKASTLDSRTDCQELRESQVWTFRSKTGARSDELTGVAREVLEATAVHRTTA